MKKRWFLLLLLPLLAPSQKARTIHPTILGARFNLLDFKTGKPFGNIDNMTSGLGFNMVKGINSHIDWSVSLDVAFSDSVINKRFPEKKLLGQAELGMRARMFKTEKRFQPFVSSGVGLSAYQGYYSAIIPAGLGIQAELFSGAYLLLQSQYRRSVPQTINHHFFYSIGFSGAISGPKRKLRLVRIDYSKPVTPPLVYTDRDHDGILDTADACPDIAGMAMFAGCPDRDNDGIQDKEDSCPDVPGLKRYAGCPIPDTDNDGIYDEEDSCVQVYGIAKYKGCPMPDRDTDGIEDNQDQCPDLSGTKENNGCPQIQKEVEEKISFAAKKILFITGSYKLSSKSFIHLAEIIDILKQDTLIQVNIEGHTDTVGSAEKNLLLSRQRARAVMNYFISKGISGTRLSSSGYGQEIPVETNNTKEGRRLNRRVEMKLRY